MIFSDDDNFLDGLGIDPDDKKQGTPAAAAASTAGKSRLGEEEEQRPARSVLDGLLGRGEKSATNLLETREKPRTFVLDKKYTQPKEGWFSRNFCFLLLLLLLFCCYLISICYEFLILLGKCFYFHIVYMQ